jgi:hypothetical protein
VQAVEGGGEMGPHRRLKMLVRVWPGSSCGARGVGMSPHHRLERPSLFEGGAGEGAGCR